MAKEEKNYIDPCDVSSDESDFGPPEYQCHDEEEKKDEDSFPFPKCKYCSMDINELALVKGVVKKFHLNCWIRASTAAIQKCREDGVAPENKEKLEMFAETHRVAQELISIIEMTDFVD